MHILLTAYGYPTKTTKGNPFVKEFVEALAAKGVKISILNYIFLNPLTFLKGIFSGGFTNWQETKGVNFVNVYYVNVIPSWDVFIPIQKRLIFLSVRIRLILYTLKHSKFSFIQQHYIVNARPWITQFISKAFNIPYVLFEHSPGLTNEQAAASKLGAFMNFEELKQFVQRAKLRLARVEAYKKIYGDLFEAKFEIMPSFIKEEYLNIPVTMQTPKEFTFIGIGDLIPRKGFERMIKAFEIFYRDSPDSRLKIVGTGPQEKELNALVERLKLQNKVLFLGLLPKVKVFDEIDSSHALIVASESETFGNTVLEAFSRGKPVVSTKCGGPETLINESNGIIVEKSVEELANGLIRMRRTISNYDSTKIRYNICAEFSEEKIIDKILGLYTNK